MADPLRRTLLAKLRGKKSKKRTAVGEFGVGNIEDNREGKDEVLFKSQWKVKQSRVVPDFNVFSDTMRGNGICTDCAPESGGIGSICENVEVKNTPAQHEIFAQMNTTLCKCGEDFEFSGRVNEEPLGVCVQSQPQTTGRDRVEKPRFNEKLNVFGDVTTGSFGRSQEQKHQPVTPPLLVSADSTGLGVFENPDLNRGRLCGGIRTLKLTDGPAFISECNGSSVGCKKDLTTRSGTCDICQQDEPNHDFDEPFIEGKDSLLSDISKMSEANICFTGTERCSFDFSNEIFKINAICTNETGLIKQEERNANHPGQKQTEYQVSIFQRSPTGSEERDLDIGGRPPSCKNGKRGQNSVDAEYDDYYDNGNVLFNECEVRITEENDGESFNHCGMKYTMRSQTNENTIHEDETARLRTQFKEAYFLLINAMHNISSDCQVGGSGFGSQMSPSSCHSHDCVALAKVISGHAWSPGDKIPQRVPGTDSMPFNGSKNSSPCLKIPLISKSFENLPSSKRSPLHRSASDGAIRYHQTHSLCVESPFAQSCMGKNGDWSKSNQITEKDRLKGLFARDDKSMENLPQENGGDGQLNNSSGSDSSFNCLPDSAKTQGDKQNFKAAQDAFAKPHGVTVNRIQGWMHKGRLLSSEMKQRITGSPPATRGSSSSHSCHRTKAVAPMVRLQGSQSVARSQGAQQSGLAEDVHGSTAAPKQPRVGKCKASSEWPHPPNTITVSKKRNWLQQSAKRGHAPEDCLNFTGGEKDRGLVSNPSVSAPGTGRMMVRHLARVSGGHPRAVDQAEEDDADDEGEIWYNPIPEDEDPRPGGTSEARDSPGGVIGRTNAARSQEPMEPRKPVLVCKAVEETLAPRSSAPDGNDSPGAGLSPLSSPKLFKKGSSINWSFPDRIRSPRTVRKLSMQMKKLPELSRKLSVKGSPQVRPRLPPGAGQVAACRNVISRYHLDSSVSTRQGSSKSASKGGYLSDGDSPELVAKAGKAAKSKDQTPASGGPKLHGAEVDTDAFRLYSFAGQPKCTQYISGLMSLHFYGAEDLKPSRADSRDVYCAIQVDSVNKARTALLTCRTGFLDMDHTFNIELENAQHLKLAVFSWETTPRRHRVCCHGSVALPTLFRVTRTHRLAVRLEPRGTIYVKLSLMERWQNWLERPGGAGAGEPQVFGVDASWVVERENTGLMVPLVVEKCIAEIERRGCQVVGLYRLCGSAAVKKELREAFERDSRAVELTEDQFPDVNVITGVLKDYLRELPNPLINQQLYEAVLDGMAKRPLRIGPSGCENDRADSQHAIGLLANLPQVEKETLHVLLDHLRLVASHHEENKMTCQNLAVCFGPVLLSQRQEASCHSNRVFAHSEELASALHFKKHIEVLHYLLQLWPVVDPHGRNPALKKGPPAGMPAASQCLLRRKERPQTLKVGEDEVSGLLRPRPGRLDSPSNRYAGDWSRCRESYFQPPRKSPREEADYDDVPWEDRGSAEEGQGGQELDLPVLAVTGGQGDQGEEGVMEEEEEETTVLPEDSTNHILLTQKHLAKENTYQAYMKIQEINPVLSNRVNLNDLQQSIDTLIGNLERELNKNKLNIGY